MKDTFTVIGAAIAGIVGLMALSYFGLQWSGFLGAEREAIRTNILQESQAWEDGKRNDLNRMYLEYQKSDSAGRMGIKHAVADQFASVDTSEFPPHLQSFLSEIGVR